MKEFFQGKYFVIIALFLFSFMLFTGCVQQITPQQAKTVIESHPYLSFLVNVDYSMTDNYSLTGVMKQPGLPGAQGKTSWSEFAMVTSDGWNRYLIEISAWDSRTYIFKKGKEVEMYTCSDSGKLDAADWKCTELFKGTLPDDPFQQYLITKDPQIIADEYNKDPEKAKELIYKLFEFVEITKAESKTVAGIETTCFKFNYKKGIQSGGDSVKILRCYHPQAGLLMFEQELGSEYYKEVKGIFFNNVKNEALFELPAEVGTE